ncbi:tetratricopeptide repeat protein [Geothermobacter ehrlichii]|uniref:Tetratricopeptide repeat protein n=1 Tax=Geothermobacter ehrlichii TaxID=213224 RepID=A0A5D3WH05_9BACT|nr:tetratricopeptide repeat protein [Geothermobacter ehrlichii]TYO96064.1 tetratricopeptide repeat protein [Geothermobacter ehrlichii]
MTENRFDRVDRIWLALLFVVAFTVFANTFGNGWTYDDFPVIVDNPDVRSLAAFLHDSHPGRPLRELTYLLDYRLFGYAPAGWHVQQIFWHALCGGLVYLLGRHLRIVHWAAGLAAFLFLLHPIQVEVVANLSHRKDSLALAFGLLAILAYFRFLERAKDGWGWLVGAVTCFGLALLGKQTAVVVPVLWLLSEMLGIAGPRRLLWSRPAWSLAIGSVAVLGGVWWLAGSGKGISLLASMRDTLAFKANYFGPFTVGIYYLTILKSWMFMGLKLLWPVKLAVEYTFPVAKRLADPWVLAGGAVLLAAGWWLWTGWRRRPVGCWLLLAGWFFFLPTANLIPMTYLAADRYFYAPLAFWSLLVAFVLQRLSLSRRAVVAVSLLVLAVLAGLSWRQCAVWRSPQTLWQRVIEVSPDSAFALNNMGNLALQRGDRKKAEEFYRRSVAVNPLNPTAHYNLGMLAEARGDLRQALEHYRDFARIDHPVYRKQLQALRQRLRYVYGIVL